jgi:Cu(I)/Ag(I) efflux system membrane fusion protein
MKKGIIAVIMLAGAMLAGVFIGSHLENGQPGDTKPQAETERGPEVLYWVAPMDPDYRRDKPGKSPMGMDLVPVYANSGLDDSIMISAAVENNLGVRTEEARVRPLWRRVEATGYVGFDETRISHINVRTEGWITRLLVNAEGEQVTKNDLLFELYSPELVNAQKEYLQAVRRNDSRLARGANEKLRALGMVPEEIESMAMAGEVSESIRVVAPQDGVVSFLGVREGMYIQPNTTIMNLADLSSVWLQAEVFESQAEWVAAGQAAEARLNYMPGEVFNGQVDYVYPILDPESRTLRVRLKFDNPGEQLKPNMYAQVSIYGKLHPNALSIPKEALIRAPGTDRVVTSLGKGQFRVHEVMTGVESGNWVEIIAGIDEGDEVVTSAQFLLDSEASLAGSIRRLGAVPDPAERPEIDVVFASGRVDAVDKNRERIRVSHGPIDELGWPSMTMEFRVLPGVDLGRVRVGQEIRFTLKQQHAGEYVIETMRTESGAVDHD